MDFTDKLTIFQELQEQFTIEPYGWTDKDVPSFLKFANLQDLIPIFQSKKVNGLEMLTSILQMSKKEFQTKFQIESYLIIKKFYLWLEILHEYNSYVQQKLTLMEIEKNDNNNNQQQQQQQYPIENSPINEDFTQEKIKEYRNCVQKTKNVFVLPELLKQIQQLHQKYKLSKCILQWSSNQITEILKQIQKPILVSINQKYSICGLSYILVINSFSTKQVSDCMGSDNLDSEYLQEISNILVAYKYWYYNQNRSQLEAQKLKSQETVQLLNSNVSMQEDFTATRQKTNPDMQASFNSNDEDQKIMEFEMKIEEYQPAEGRRSKLTEDEIVSNQHQESVYEEGMLTSTKFKQEIGLLDHKGNLKKNNEKLTGSQLINKINEQAKQNIFEKEKELDEKIKKISSKNNSLLKDRNSTDSNLGLIKSSPQKSPFLSFQQNQPDIQSVQQEMQGELGTSIYMDQNQINKIKQMEEEQLQKETQNQLGVSEIMVPQTQNNNQIQQEQQDALGQSEIMEPQQQQQKQQQQNDDNALGCSQIIEENNNNQQQNNDLGSSQIISENNNQINGSVLITNPHQGSVLLNQNPVQGSVLLNQNPVQGSVLLNQNPVQGSVLLNQNPAQGSVLLNQNPVQGSVLLNQNPNQGSVLMTQNPNQGSVLMNPNQGSVLMQQNPNQGSTLLTNGSIILDNSNRDKSTSVAINQPQTNNSVLKTNQQQQKINLSDQEIQYREFQKNIKELEEESLFLPFNPFDFKNINQMKIKIKFINSNHVKEKVLHMDGATFGRYKDNTIVFDKENMISKYHARIIFENDQFYLQDMGSNTGTWIKIMQEMELKINMRIQFGNKIEVVIQNLEINEEKNEGLMKLSFEKPVNSVQQIQLKQNRKVKLGRDEEQCQICIKDQQQILSKEHACFVYRDGKFYINDELSVNGTWLRLSAKTEKSELYPLKLSTKIRLSSMIRIEINSINILNVND